MVNEEYVPSETNPTAVAHAVSQDLARQDTILNKDGIQLLNDCQQCVGRLTDQTKNAG